MLTIIILGCGIMLSCGQTRTLSGKVIFSADQQPIKGASVLIKGIKQGYWKFHFCLDACTSGVDTQNEQVSC